MSNVNYNFSEEFTLQVQKKFISILIFDKKWAALNGIDIVKPEYFENRILYNICRWIHEYYKEYKDIPTRLVLTEKSKDFVNAKGLTSKEYYQYSEAIDHIFTLDEGDDLEFFKTKAIEFVRQVAWKQALEKGGDAFKAGNCEQAINEFRRILSLGSENDLGMDYSEMPIEQFLSVLGETYDRSRMITTGIKSWDDALGGGFVSKNTHIIAAPPGYGKSVDVNTPVLTPTGWKKAGEVKVGDYFIGRNGKPTKVIGVFPQGKISNYKVIFNDQSETNCCENHLWTVYDRNCSDKNKEFTYSLKELMEKGIKQKASEKRLASGRKPAVRWAIPLVKPVEFEEKPLIIRPYNMGVLLGDGCLCGDSVVAFSNPLMDIEIKDKFEKLLPDTMKLQLSNKNYVDDKGGCPQYKCINKVWSNHKDSNPYITEIRRLNLAGTKSGTKFIPEEYKFGSVEQRIELLRGLLDTDGHIEIGNKTTYATISKKLAEDVVELVQSLGGMAHIRISTRKPRALHNFRDETYYRVCILLNDINPFFLKRKAERWRKTDRRKYITEVVKQEDVESVCFKVDAEDELFVIEHYIVTHNSRIMAYLAKHCLEEMKKVIFITLELSEAETMANINTSVTGITLHEMLNPVYRQQFVNDVTKFKDRHCSDLVVKFFKPGTVTCDTIHNYIQKVIQHKTEKLGRSWKPDVIILDYMDKLLPSQKIKGNIYEDVGGIANDTKNLAISFDCPVITGSQLGRYVWNLSGDQVVSMDSVAESSQKVHLAHSMTTLNVNKGEKNSGKIRLYLAKSRSGKPNSLVWCDWDIGRCQLSESEPWDPKALDEASDKFSVKSSDSRR